MIPRFGDEGGDEHLRDGEKDEDGDDGDNATDGGRDKHVAVDGTTGRDALREDEKKR